jgi:hypothetical protein
MTLPLAFLPRTCRRLAFAALAAASPLLLFPVHTPAGAAAGSEAGGRTAYVLFSAGDRGSTMSGSTEDFSRARALRVGSEAMLFVRRGGADYVIRDAATLRRAAAIFEPQQALGRKQGELGRRQGELGREQGRLGRLQAEASSRQQSELGRQQSALGARQAALGREQAALGRQQARLAVEANAKLRALLAEAIARGAARRVD